MKKESFKQFKNRIIESLLSEADAVEQDKTNDSLDSQVDHYLTQYESESKLKQRESAFKASRKFLFEDEEAEEQPAKSIDSINIENFASDVVRLIENCDSLLEFKGTIAKRASNFLKKMYDESVVSEFEVILEQEHGIAPGKSKSQVDNDQFKAPPADRAIFDSGSGGGA